MKWILFLLPWFYAHEGGHYLAALFCGQRLKFFYSQGSLWGIPIPRYCWYMPWGLSGEKETLIYRAGFALEFAVGVILTALWTWIGLAYLLGTLVHRLAYVHYGGNPKEIGR